ncbi:hypothetical protein D9757_004160 [Collybiopsis confluens]|uniref:WD40 repeat-like protein n=1 Tax=Collybiopsis confluens TaxID=2823264 RepID=A0A8H5HUQ8_9AGAR|nr:hypothetical protein D9757_004160 [Collybiopsis confluens]
MSHNSVLLASSQLGATSSPLRSSVDGNSETYILALAGINAKYAAMSSASRKTKTDPSTTGPIHLYSKHTLQKSLSLPGHDTASAFMRTVHAIAGSNGQTLVSSGQDGSVKVWDERTGSHGIKMSNLGKSRAILSFDVSVDGYTVAAGTELQSDDSLVLYWDPRKPAAPLRAHSSTHSDDITVVQFSPNRPSTLLTASSDGLLSLSDANEQDEDEAVVHVGNFGCSVSQAGWMADGSHLDLLQSHDIRAPSLHSGPTQWVTDYLITASTSTASGQPNHLSVFVGSNEGDAALLTNNDLSTSQSLDPNAGHEWILHKLWLTGHEGVVRSSLWDDQDQVLVTGGEDGKIHIWPEFAHQTGLGGRGLVVEDDAMDVDLPSDGAGGSRKNIKRMREKNMDSNVDEEVNDKNGKNGKRMRR